MKIKIALGLCAVLGASLISARAADNPAQAAARAALEQKMYELDHPQTAPAVPVTSSQTVVGQPGKSAANVTGTVFEKAATPQTAPVPTTPVAASAAVAPAAAAPAAAASAMSPMILAFLILSFLLLLPLLPKLLRLSSHCYGCNQDSISNGTYNAQANPATRCD